MMIIIIIIILLLLLLLLLLLFNNDNDSNNNFYSIITIIINALTFSVCCQDDSNSSVLAGQCDCKVNTVGRQCNMCKDGFYNLSASHPNGCIPCGCILDGTKNRNSSCHTTTGQCDCKDRVTGISNKMFSQFSRLFELLD